MSATYQNFLRPLLFRFDSEWIHHRTLEGLAWISQQRMTLGWLRTLCQSPGKPIELFGLRFPNRLGLAAGMDKNAAALPVWEALGFGFVEIGGVTWHTQPGNPQPRMFRVVEDEALINRMGFNNVGAGPLAQRLQCWKDRALWPSHPVAINLGKSKITPLDRAAEDYAQTFRRLRPFGDFFVINVSSPNTPNLRQLQDKGALLEIVTALQEINQSTPEPKPILVKISPDLEWSALDELLEVVLSRRIAGVVATNTTLARPSHPDGSTVYQETGGLSGRPLGRRSTEVIAHIRRQTRGQLPIIGVGGIFSEADAREKLDAGADLLQIYTGLVFKGPGLIREIVKAI